MSTEPSSLEAVLPLTPLQEGLLFHAQYDEQDGPDVYVMQLGMDIDGPLDVPTLRSAARVLLQRHANLRAGFRDGGARPLQFVPKAVDLPWRETDLTGLPEPERDAALREITDQDRAARFDLHRPPLLRFTVVRTAPLRHRLLVTNHHILLDGWSAPVLVRELFELYAAGVPRAGMAAYAASKAAATMFTKSLGLEVARHGIRCNVVAPGSTDTPMLSSMWTDPSGPRRTIEGSPEDFRLGIPLGKLATPSDIAEAVAFLLSDQASHITLHALTVDGGAALGS